MYSQKTIISKMLPMIISKYFLIGLYKSFEDFFFFSCSLQFFKFMLKSSFYQQNWWLYFGWFLLPCTSRLQCHLPSQPSHQPLLKSSSSVVPAVCFPAGLKVVNYKQGISSVFTFDQIQSLEKAGYCSFHLIRVISLVSTIIILSDSDTFSLSSVLYLCLSLHRKVRVAEIEESR